MTALMQGSQDAQSRSIYFTRWQPLVAALPCHQTIGIPVQARQAGVSGSRLGTLNVEDAPDLFLA